MSKQTQDGWQQFHLDEIVKKVEGNDPRCHEFLHVRSMSMAFYRLPKGAKVMQSPHLEDEIYLVVESKATLMVNGKEQEAGSKQRRHPFRRRQHTTYVF